jgi:sulfur-oxidizing protein SoxX
MRKSQMWVIAAAVATLGTTVQAQTAAEIDALTQKALATFHSKGIAKVERLIQDDSNRLCSEADASGKPLDAATAKAIEEANMKAIHWPANGQFLGDWKKGEKVAASGKGMTWKDKTTSNNGGNCYNCHQIDKAQVSYGTLGPSLWNYGKLRGVSDPSSPAAKAVVEYTWGKLWNARAYNACSNMPRAGHNGVLTEDQVRDVMALLLDPKSPVNQ